MIIDNVKIYTEAGTFVSGGIITQGDKITEIYTEAEKENIGEVLIENIPQLWMGMVGILLNSIVVGTLFGKRKYDWFFPVICSVRFIIYNIGFLAIGNAMYGNETWYKITMSTFATVTALGVGIATAVLWQDSVQQWSIRSRPHRR